jgi:hypothetical protein
VELFDNETPATIRMRALCVRCGGTSGRITTKSGQDCVYCTGCGAFAYNAPRVETGRAPRTVSTVHNGIKPKQRARLILRANGRCEMCGARGDLHVGHVLSVAVGLEHGLTERELNDDENLIAACPECNLGLGSEPMPTRLLVAILRARIACAKRSGGGE